MSKPTQREIDEAVATLTKVSPAERRRIESLARVGGVQCECINCTFSRNIPRRVRDNSAKG